MGCQIRYRGIGTSYILHSAFCMSMSTSMSMQSCSLSMQYVYVYNEVKNDLIRERGVCLRDVRVGAGGGEGRALVDRSDDPCKLPTYCLLPTG